MSTSQEAREWELISKLELRIALANSDSKLESILRNYLAPLLLKLGSDRVEVRNKVIGVCQHVNKRIGPPSISLPVEALIQQFKNVQTPLVRHFDLIYIKQGIERMRPSSRVDLLPLLVQGISQIESASYSATIFNLVLKLLPLLQLPQRSGEEDTSLNEKLGMSREDSAFLAKWFAKVLLLTAATNDLGTCPGLTPSEYTFVNAESTYAETWNSSAHDGLNLVVTKLAIARFLASGAFANKERFIPAVIASADVNSRLADIGDDILKRFHPDLEDSNVVEQLFTLYFGTKEKKGDWAPPARPPVQVKILDFLSKSMRAARSTQHIDQLLNEGFSFSSSITSHGLEASKLRSQIFSFITWVARMGSPSDLDIVAPKAIQRLKDFIVNQGWPSPSPDHEKLKPADLDLRSLAYETIGLLTPKMKRQTGASTTNFDFDLIQWLFASLSSDASSGQIFVSIQQALGSLLNSVAGVADESLRDKLRPFLIHNMSLTPGRRDPLTGVHVIRSTRFTTVRFANRILPFGDVQARWIDLMAVGGAYNEKSELAEEGQKGLDPYWYQLLNPQNDIVFTSLFSGTTGDGYEHDSTMFTELTEDLFGLDEEIEGTLHTKEISAPARFSGLYVGSLAPAVTFSRNVLLCEALVTSNAALGIERDWEHRLDSIISTNEEARLFVRKHLKTLGHTSITRFLKTSLSGLLWNNGQGLGRSGDHCAEILSLSSNEIMLPVLHFAPLLNSVILSNNLPMQDIGAKIFGILASHPDYPSEKRNESLFAFNSLIPKWKEAVGQEANRIRGALLALTYFYTRLAYRGLLSSTIPEEEVQRHVSFSFEILRNTRDTVLKDASQAAIGQLSLASVITPFASINDGLGEDVVDKLYEDAKKGKELAAVTLGQLSIVLSNAEDTSLFEKISKSLYDLHEIRRPEIQFAVGEALSAMAVGWRSKSLVAAFDVDAAWPQSNVPSHIVSNLIEKVLMDSKAPKPSLRKASAIWLLCLVQFCGHVKEIEQQLRRCQANFLWLLSDNDEIVQETASRGLGLVYEKGNQNLKDELVRDLVRSFTTDSSNLRGGKVSKDTELFEPGALPTGEGASVTTYKDIVGLASEVGDPSLVYRLMSLASNNAIWSSRAAFGRFGLSNVLSDSSVNGYLAQNPKVYPKLFRYRFDPNSNVQRSMNDIWNALVKDSNSTIDTHFDAILEDLLKSILAGREWRVRQASCAAISDLVQGRPIERYEKYLNEILTKAFKVLDDIKGSVRQAALGLCQALTSIVLRTLESGGSHSRRAMIMLEHVIPFLLSHEGMDSAAEEVQAYSISTLTKIIKKSPAQTLRPFVPQIIEKFLSSLSSLEPQAVNYVHLNADKYGLTGQEIDKMRLSAIRTSPMMESIELYLLDMLDEDSMVAVISKLEFVLRSAIGLPSKVGISRVLVILSSKSILFRPHADRFIRLMRKHVLDRNDTVSASFSSSIGYIARLASSEEVLRTVEFAKSLYFEAEETSHRVISGEILYSISSRANDRVSEFAASILPFVFVAMHDFDSQVKEIFDKTWSDNVSGPRSISLYLDEILDLVSANLESHRWSIKHTSSITVAALVSSLDDQIDIAVAERIWPIIEKAIGGKTWEGKEKVLEGFVKLCSRTIVFSNEKGIRDQMKVGNF